jgi:transketolase
VANDLGALEDALRRAMAVEDRPSLIVLRSHIGWPSPTYTDTAHAHGNPLGEDEVRATKEILGLPPAETFWVPDEVRELYRRCVPRGQSLRREWQDRMDRWDGDRERLDACLGGRGLLGWEAKLPTFQAGEERATRVASDDCLNAIADVVPGLLAGGADLTGNTGTKLADHGVQSAADPAGRLLYFGVREHAMGAVMTGEEGPTHQPVEQLAAMRAMPGLRMIRPADANEVAHAWRVAVGSNGPTALLLARQKVPVLEETADRHADVARGAYVLDPGGDDPDVVLVGTGSEVHVCLEAAARLLTGGVRARVVSMPSWELFEDQEDD